MNLFDIDIPQSAKVDIKIHIKAVFLDRKNRVIEVRLKLAYRYYH